MALVLIVLAAGSIFAGYAGVRTPSADRTGSSGFSSRASRPGETGAPAAGTNRGAGHEAVSSSSDGRVHLVAFGGIAIATFFFLWNRRRPTSWRCGSPACIAYWRTSTYVDEFYDAAVVQPIRIVSEEGLWKVVDARFIDGSVNGVGRIVGGRASCCGGCRADRSVSYAASVMLGVVVIVGYYVWR